MKEYNIKVNGISYKVEVEEVGAAPAGALKAQPTGQASRPVASTQPAAKPAPPKPAATTSTQQQVSAGAQTISAPMPGTVLEVRVSPGQSVKSGDILLILEAMKMENEIMAPKDGVVGSVEATKGANVNAGDTLLTIG